MVVPAMIIGREKNLPQLEFGIYEENERLKAARSFARIVKKLKSATIAATTVIPFAGEAATVTINWRNSANHPTKAVNVAKKRIALFHFCRA
jgi:hypothetical protein